jgi:hypothetical protein
MQAASSLFLLQFLVDLYLSLPSASSVLWLQTTIKLSSRFRQQPEGVAPTLSVKLIFFILIILLPLYTDQAAQ